MGQTPPKYFLPSAPYGSSEAANALNPVQPAAVNPQIPLLPTNFQDPGTIGGKTSVSAPPAKLGGNQSPSSGQDFSKLFRGLFGLMLFFFAIPCFATTPVTGTLQNLGLGTVGQGAFVRFWLRGCGGNVPRIGGTALIAPSQGSVYFFDMVANSSGVISGTLYSTRDSTGALGGDIECGGSTLSVWYGMQVFVAGKGSVEIPLHAKNGITLDVTTAVPINQTPAANAPNGDVTYLRLDAANAPVTGNVGIFRTTTLFVTGLTVGNCVQVTTGGQLTTSSGPCGTSSGTLTATGAPVAGNLAKFSGATSLTNGDLSGDCTTPGTLVITCTKTNGSIFSASATTDTTNASNITSGNLSVNRLNGGTGASSTTFWRGDGTWASTGAGVSVAAAADLTGQSANISPTTLVTPGANGFYRMSCYVVLTRAASSTSTLPNCQVGYTDVDLNSAQTLNMTSTTSANTLLVASGISNPIMGFYAKSGVAITYSTAGYASTGGTSMQYAVHIRLEGPF